MSGAEEAEPSAAAPMPPQPVATTARTRVSRTASVTSALLRWAWVPAMLPKPM
ncbi:hypothetical protein QBB31_14570 [Streptomyces scabiei]|uniref:hypothetical protein n=1 Tax=Streptomyces scabiei TaxID=1930 RepID=UPI002FEEEC15